jgi:regulator of protease activity HflC (stomatin/prohibitin superfamily)
MEYNKVIAVTGLPGLYELLSSKADGAIVRALDDKTTRFVSSRIHNFSHLESIEVYTVRDNVNLVDILKAMEASSEKLPDDKDNAALKSYFGKVYPDLDFDRVYSSDLKKMVKWFSVLKANDIEIKLSEPSEEEAGEVEAPVVEEAPAPKKKAAAKEEKSEPAKTEEKPAKKATKAEAKTEEEEEKPKAKKSAAAKTEEKPAPKKKAEKAAEAPAAEKPKKAPAKKK